MTPRCEEVEIQREKNVDIFRERMQGRGMKQGMWSREMKENQSDGVDTIE